MLPPLLLLFGGGAVGDRKWDVNFVFVFLRAFGGHGRWSAPVYRLPLVDVPSGAVVLVAGISAVLSAAFVLALESCRRRKQREGRLQIIHGSSVFVGGRLPSAKPRPPTTDCVVFTCLQGDPQPSLDSASALYLSLSCGRDALCRARICFVLLVWWVAGEFTVLCYSAAVLFFAF